MAEEAGEAAAKETAKNTPTDGAAYARQGLRTVSRVFRRYSQERFGGQWNRAIRYFGQAP